MILHPFIYNTSSSDLTKTARACSGSSFIEFRSRASQAIQHARQTKALIVGGLDGNDSVREMLFLYRDEAEPSLLYGDV